MHRAEGVTEAVARIVESLEGRIDDIAARAADAVFEQIPVYSAHPDQELHGKVFTHGKAVQRVLLTTLKEGRAARPEDFPLTAWHAADRVQLGIPLSALLQAYRVNQVTLWDSVRDLAGEDPEARDAALSIVDKIMQVTEVGSSVAAEMYALAQQRQIANSDRLRRDLLEDLLLSRNVSAGPKRSLLQIAGLEMGTRIVVASGVAVQTEGGDNSLHDAGAGLRAFTGQGFTVVRQDEVVGIAPIPVGVSVIERFQRSLAELERLGLPLAVGVSTVHTGLSEIPDAYAESVSAREALGSTSGVVALPMLSCLDYLVLQNKETARRLIRPEVRQFVEEDLARGGELTTTLIEYAASDLNAKSMAQHMHMHANTAYYRLNRIAERSGRDLRGFHDVVELLIAVRLLEDRVRIEGQVIPIDQER